jgi:hypothetical protein
MQCTPSIRFLLSLGLLSSAAGCPSNPALEDVTGTSDELSEGRVAPDGRTKSMQDEHSEDETLDGDVEEGDEMEAPEPAAPAELDCTDGEGVVAEFGCESVVTRSCKDLSNVVLEFEDGQRERFEGLSGYSATFSGTGENEGKVVVRVWIKSGNNHSGDGPGYGTSFDAPGDACEPEAETPGEPGEEDPGVPPIDEECGDQPDEECVEPTPPGEEDPSDPPTDEECGDQPDEQCAEPTPPEEPCDASDPDSECWVVVPD